MTRSNPDNTPLTSKAKRCKKVLIGVLGFKKESLVTILFVRWTPNFNSPPGGSAALCLRVKIAFA